MGENGILKVLEDFLITHDEQGFCLFESERPIFWGHPRSLVALGDFLDFLSGTFYRDTPISFHHMGGKGIQHIQRFRQKGFIPYFVIIKDEDTNELSFMTDFPEWDNEFDEASHFVIFGTKKDMMDEYSKEALEFQDEQEEI